VDILRPERGFANIHMHDSQLRIRPGEIGIQFNGVLEQWDAVLEISAALLHRQAVVCSDSSDGVVTFSGAMSYFCTDAKRFAQFGAGGGSYFSECVENMIFVSCLSLGGCQRFSVGTVERPQSKEMARSDLRNRTV